MRSPRVVVLGGGLAGIGFARHHSGATIYEAEAQAGGYARSHHFAGVWFDQGAHICHSSDPDWLERMAPAGPWHEISRSIVLNYKAGNWFAYPVQNHLADLPPAERDAALAGFLAAQEKYRGREPRNYEEWCRFQYGDFLVENFYRLYTAKYWHVPMAELATDWLPGRLLPSQVQTILDGARSSQEEQQAVFHSFRYPVQGGFGAILSPLLRGLNVRLNKRAVLIEPRSRRVCFADGETAEYDLLVATIPLPDLIRMIADAPRAVADAAGRLRALRHYCVNFVVTRADLRPIHWFYIYDPEVAASRVSFPGALAGATTSSTAIQAEIFQPAAARPDEEQLREKTLADLGKILRFDRREVTAAEIRCYPTSYVISDHARAPAAEFLRSWLRERNIETAGLFGSWMYLWSDRAYASGRQLAEALGQRQ